MIILLLSSFGDDGYHYKGVVNSRRRDVTFDWCLFSRRNFYSLLRFVCGEGCGEGVAFWLSRERFDSHCYGFLRSHVHLMFHVHLLKHMAALVLFLFLFVILVG